jgi:RNA polymerase sigma-70 factor, ECF subfamily
LEEDDEDPAMTDSGQAAARAAADSPDVAQPGSGANAEADGEILRALSRGDRRRALSLCVERHGGSIGRLCMAMLGAQGDADDVTQETLLAAYEAFGDFRREGTLRAWLLGIARNKCLQHLERQRRRGARLQRVDAPRAAPEEGEQARRRAQQARRLLERVRPSDRDALLLRYCSELSFKEVAAACGIEEATARKRVSRALLALRSTLKESGDD